MIYIYIYTDFDSHHYWKKTNYFIHNEKEQQTEASHVSKKCV